MIRAQRRFHIALWPLLAFVVLFGLTMALVLRPPPDPPAAEATQ